MELSHFSELSLSREPQWLQVLLILDSGSGMLTYFLSHLKLVLFSLAKKCVAIFNLNKAHGTVSYRKKKKVSFFLNEDMKM